MLIPHVDSRKLKKLDRWLIGFILLAITSVCLRSWSIAASPAPPPPIPMALLQVIPLVKICDANAADCATVTGNKLDVNAVVTASTAGTTVSFGSGTASGPGYPSAVYSTNAAPAYTEGTFNALSSDLTGALRVAATVNASLNTAGISSSANQTNGAQLTQICDVGLDCVTVTGSKLDVNATVTPPALQNVNLTQAGSASVVQCSTANCASVGIPTLVMNPVGNPANVRIDTAGTGAVTVTGTVTVTDGAGALNTIVDSGTLTAVTSITNPVSTTCTSATCTAAITGTVGVTGISSPLPPGTNIIGALSANQSVNLAQVAGITPATAQVGASTVSTGGTGTVTDSVQYGVYSTTTRTLTNGQVAPVTLTSSGAQAVTPTGYSTAVAWGSSVNLAVTNTALVTVGSGLRVVLHRANFTCASTVSVAVTVSLGFATATLPSSGAGLIWAGMVTGASAFQGLQDGTGWPNVLGVGASDEDLRLTMTVPTGGSCQISLTYSTESTS